MNLRPATAITETGGPTNLAVGGIADGQVSKRSGTSFQGVTLAGTLAGSTIYDPDSLATGVSTVTPTQEFQNAQSAGIWTNSWDLSSIGVSQTIGPRGMEITGPTGGGAVKVAGFYPTGSWPSGDFAVLTRLSGYGPSVNTTGIGFGFVQDLTSTGDIYWAGFRGSVNAAWVPWLSTLASSTSAAVDLLVGTGTVWADLFILMRYGSASAHVTTYMGANLTNLQVVDKDRNIGYTPTHLMFMVFALSSKVKLITPYVRVISDTYPGATYDFPPTINGRLLGSL